MIFQYKEPFFPSNTINAKKKKDPTSLFSLSFLITATFFQSAACPGDLYYLKGIIVFLVCLLVKSEGFLVHGEEMYLYGCQVLLLL